MVLLPIMASIQIGVSTFVPITESQLEDEKSRYPYLPGFDDALTLFNVNVKATGLTTPLITTCEALNEYE